MNKTWTPLKKNLSEINLASLDTLQSILVKPKRLKDSPINMECVLHEIINLPSNKNNYYNGIIIGKVIGIHINDNFIKEGIVDVEKIKPLSRLGYMDYSVVDNIFSMKRPSIK